MIDCTFPVTAIPDGKMNVVIKVSDQDYKEMLKYRDTCAFGTCEALHQLYEKVIRTVQHEIAESMAKTNYLITDLLDGEYDYNKALACVKDYYDITADYPEDLDEKMLID